MKPTLRLMIIASLLLSGCATTIHSDGSTVLIQHGTGSAKQAVETAQIECAKVGKTIEFEDMRCPGQCISKFRCVPK